MMVTGNSDLLGTQQQSVQATNNFASTVKSIFISSGSSGIGVHAFNTIASSVTTLVLSANSSRASVTFSNPGTVDIFVGPTLDANGATLSPSTGSLGGTFRIFSNGGTLTLTGAVQTSWVAFSSSGSGNSFTVLESNTR
jgi:hypothetical protein